MSEKTIKCPFCKEPILVDFSGDSNSFLCPGCHEAFQVAKKTRRTRRTGLVVDGQAFSVKEQPRDGESKTSQVTAAQEHWKKDRPEQSFHDRVLTTPKKTGRPQPPQGYPPNFYPPQAYYPQGYPPPPPGYPPGYFWPVPPAVQDFQLEMPSVAPTYEAQKELVVKKMKRTEEAVTQSELEPVKEDEYEYEVVLENSHPPILSEVDAPAAPFRGDFQTPPAPVVAPEAGGEEEVMYEEADHVRRSKKRALTTLLTGILVVALFALALWLLQNTDADLLSRAPEKINSPVLGSATSRVVADRGTRLKIDLSKFEFEGVRRPETITQVPANLRGGPASPTSKERHAVSRKVAKAFLDAKSLEERAKFSRLKPETAERMQKFYLKNPDGPIDYVLLADADIVALDPRYLAFRVVLASEETRYIGLEATDEGYKVDWESFVLYSDMDWTEFMTVKPTKPTQFRIFVEAADYYNLQFLDRKKFACYRIYPKSLDAKPVYGYTASDGDTDMALKAILRMTPGVPAAAPVVLTMGYPENALTDNQVLIDRLVSNGWLVQE